MSWAKFNRLSSSKDLSIFRRGSTASDGGGGGGGGNDPDAQAYIDALDAAGYTISGTEEAAINNHFLDLKATGPNNSTYDWWTGIVRLLPFIGNTSAQQAIKAEDPANSITFAGGVTHNATGVEGNGVNGYYIFFNPSEIIDTDNWSAWVYKRKDIQENKYDFSGDGYPSSIKIRLRGRDTSDRLVASAGTTSELSSPTGVITNGAGFVGVTKWQSIGYDAYARGAKFSRPIDAYGSPNVDVFGLARNVPPFSPNNYSVNEHGYALVTTGISTTTEEAALRATVEAFMTALSRNVP